MVPCWLPGKIFSNYLIGATDAHAKNHSLLLVAPDDIRLAPLYDVASIAPYRSLAPSARKPRSRNFPQTRLSSSCA
ncbi:HipA domain-containing protein [uncultured Ellagibacter sp.]|uniref:HipA domain-containing protein n=1 Tax=uncultured Ellagibacter sp. TaxID=2137580 RepID=UPI00260217C0|nr:HipA domain-containing protein [uncultured Ellagibacter sp.]